MGQIIFSNWDSEHFGVKIGKYIPHAPEDISSDMERARAEGYNLLITRISTNEIEIVNALEKNGFELKDTIVHYKVNLERTEYFPSASAFNIREARIEDAPVVREIAKRTFKDYIGHFHKDKRLEKDKCDELYAKWAENSVKDKNIAEAVLIAEEDHRILGFATIKIISEHESQGILFGTAPEAQGRGVYTTLIREAINWSKRRNLKEFIYGTQVDNYVVQNVFMKVGGEIYRSFYTLHCWIRDVCGE